METVLAPSYVLSTDHPAASPGKPMLVNRATGEAYGPGDALQPYPSWGFMSASAAALRMAKTAKLDALGREMLNAFRAAPVVT